MYKRRGKQGGILPVLLVAEERGISDTGRAPGLGLAAGFGLGLSGGGLDGGVESLGFGSGLVGGDGLEGGVCGSSFFCSPVGVVGLTDGGCGRAGGVLGSSAALVSALGSAFGEATGCRGAAFGPLCNS